MGFALSVLLLFTNFKSRELISYYKLILPQILLKQCPLFFHYVLILVEIHKVIIEIVSPKALNARASQSTGILPWHLTGCGDADPHNSLKSTSSA